jgi:1,4-alpha-glucan branching enzyme
MHNNKNVISIVLNAHLPFVRHPELNFSYEELPFFSMVSETLLPLLETIEHLEADAIPFKIGLVLSPILCHLLTDEYMIGKYCAWLDKQIAFGQIEMQRTKDNPDLLALANYYHERATMHKENFTKKYDSNLPEVFGGYHKKGIIELICSPATNCFLPFYTDRDQAIKAELEEALSSFSRYFHSSPQGIWLPELGWHPKLADYLRSYNFKWTIIETHAALLASPPAKLGSFYPVKTKTGINLLIKDFYAFNSIVDKKTGMPASPVFRDYYNDAADELPAEAIKLFLSAQGSRIQTGFKYRAIDKRTYNVQRACEQAKVCADLFLEQRKTALHAAEDILAEEKQESEKTDGMKQSPSGAKIDGQGSQDFSGGGDNKTKEKRKKLISLCAWDADFFGRFWHEGPCFLEQVFRQGAEKHDIQFLTPSEYITGEDKTAFQTVDAEFSSSSLNGYAESFVDASNDWTYRHITRSLDRMVELAGRFNEEAGIKARCLNQASREILLSLSSDWPRLLSDSNVSPLSAWRSYSKARLEEHLRCFTTIYESLGSHYLSTRFITDLEQRHNIFPMIDYRIFRKK